MKNVNNKTPLNFVYSKMNKQNKTLVVKIHKKFIYLFGDETANY